MKNKDETTHSTNSRAFTQEMRQVFVDWVSKLPFIKRDPQKDQGEEGLEEKSEDQLSISHPADHPMAGGSPSTEGEDR